MYELWSLYSYLPFCRILQLWSPNNSRHSPTPGVYIKAEALFQLAGLKRKQKELQQAKELYRLLVTDYSGSVYSIEAAKLYRDLEAGEQTEVNNL
mgnify:CR=1 FL=1